MGVMPVDYSVVHRSHPAKTMIICTTGFIPFEGDVTLGGLGVKVGFKRVGGYVEAKTDSFKRKYKEDGTYSYPKVEEGGEQLRVKGQMYFENWEITGSKRSNAGVPKFSLLDYWRDELLPDCDKVAAKYNVIIRYQWDGAGPHNDKTLLAYLRSEFNRRGWIFDFQASKMPILNVHDACVFPHLSKKVSSNQAFQFDGKRTIMKEDEIWVAAQAAYDEMDGPTIARAYAGHAQIVCAMLEHEGDVDQFTRGGNGAGHYGISKSYVATEDGVVILEECMPSDSNSGGLKYKPPTLAELAGDKSREELLLELREDQYAVLGEYVLVERSSAIQEEQIIASDGPGGGGGGGGREEGTGEGGENASTEIEGSR